MHDPQFSRTIFRILSIVMGALLLIAAATKFSSPLEIERSISFILFGRPSASMLPYVLAMLVVAVEIGLGITLILARPIAALVWMLRHARCTRRDDDRTILSRGAAPRRAGGFTLIELILSIAVIALLITLALPSLAGARMRAKMAWSLSTQRQIGAAIHLYAQDHAETLPILGEPEPLGAGLVGPGGGRIGSSYFLSNLYRWSTLLYPQYIPTISTLKPGPHDAEDELIEDGGWIRSPFFLTFNAWADPRFWNDGYPTPVRELLRATRIGEIRFPSEKGLVLDIHHGAMNRTEFPGYRNLSVGRADGSAGELDWWSVPLSALYSNPRWPIPWRLPVLATRDGLWGRDFNIPYSEDP